MTRVRRTRAWWSKTVERYKDSGLTARAFAAREGLSGATLSWWSSQLGRGTRAGRWLERAVALEVQLGGDAHERRFDRGAAGRRRDPAACLCSMPTETRRGHDGLFAIARGLGLDPFSGHLFAFVASEATGVEVGT